MSGINVLSDSLSGGSKLAKTSSMKGNNATDSLADTMVEFAAMLSGLTTMNADPMGQNSMIGQEKEAGQDPDPLVQNLGYSHFVLSFLSQPNELSDLPAGKEANSGNGVNQGTDSLISNEVFGIKGMTSQILQGNNPGTSELDNYRQIISELLTALSGQITESSSEGVALASELGLSQRQEMMKLVQGWLTVANPSIVEGQAQNLQATVSNIEGIKGPQGAGLDTAIEETLTNTLNPSSSRNDTVTDSAEEGVSLGLVNAQIIEGNSKQGKVTEESLRQDIARTVKEWMQGMDGGAESELNPSLQKVIKPLLDFLTKEQGDGNRELSPKSSALLTVLNQVLNQVPEANVPRGVVKEMLQADSNELEAIIKQPKIDSNVSDKATSVSKDIMVHGDFKQKLAEIDQLHSKPLKAEPSDTGVKASQNQDINPGIGLEGKIQAVSVAEGKTSGIPVWEQISNVFRERVSSRNHELKELDIQLHPADLGRIRIGLRWENGQVHLQVHASEAATSQILQSQLTELRNTLTNQGVNCGTLQMGQQGREQQQNQNHQEQFHRTQDSNTNLIEDEDPLTVLNLPSHADLNNRINVTA
ncbi:MAG TPA: hypothetical protein DEF42_04830 [Desulfosporosinus sp.]|nr:hypothetical protein [Desulfosporosinus sp.]